MNILEVQTALARAGYLPGDVDGIFGRKTAAAVRAFQRDNNLQVDGIVGPQTTAALAGYAASAGSTATFAKPPLVWLGEARSLLGLKEGPGAINNPTILRWAGPLGQSSIYKSDDIPWCGLFVAHCIGATLPEEPLPGNPLRARAWEKFGNPIKPTRGAIIVFWRKSIGVVLVTLAFM